MRRARVLLAALAMSAAMSTVMSAARPAWAEDAAVPPAPHHHPRVWYGGWSMILLGGAATLVGVALSTRTDDTTAAAGVGWSLAGVGTATWVGGALTLRWNEKRERERPRDSGYSEAPPSAGRPIGPVGQP